MALCGSLLACRLDSWSDGDQVRLARTPTQEIARRGRLAVPVSPAINHHHITTKPKVFLLSVTLSFYHLTSPLRVS